jgi:hypothetical protein
MHEKLFELIKNLEPDLRELVVEVIEKEREYIDYLKPKGIKEDIRELIDKYAKHGIGSGDPR